MQFLHVFRHMRRVIDYDDEQGRSYGDRTPRPPTMMNAGMSIRDRREMKADANASRIAMEMEWNDVMFL